MPGVAPPTSCSLSSTNMPWHTCARTHTHARTWLLWEKSQSVRHLPTHAANTLILSPYPSTHWEVFPISFERRKWKFRTVRKFPWAPRQTRIPICICMTLKPEVLAQESCLSQTFLNPPAPGPLPECLCKEFIPPQTPSVNSDHEVRDKKTQWFKNIKNYCWRSNIVF